MRPPPPGTFPYVSNCNFSFGLRNQSIAGPQFFFWPARSSIAAPQFFFRPARSPIAVQQFFFLPARSVDYRAVSFGRRDPRFPRRNFSRGRRDAVPRFFKRPARCRAAIYQEAGVMPCRDFSKGQRDAAPQFSRGRRDAAPQFFKRPA